MGVCLWYMDRCVQPSGADSLRTRSNWSRPTTPGDEEGRIKKPYEGFTVWFRGLPCAGKTTLAHLLAADVARRGMEIELLDADVLFKTLSKGLGFSKGDRDDNIRRIGFVCMVLQAAR
jgi:adenylylsulfate kinase-like enzyme